MMKVPTNSAIPANTSRKMLTKARPSVICAVASSAASWPVRTTTPSPTTARTSAARASCVTPSAATASISVYASSPSSSSSWAYAVSKAAMVAPARLPDVPYRKIPTSEASRGPSGPTSGTVSPTA